MRPLAVLALVSAGLAACGEPPVAETAATEEQAQPHWQAYGADRPAGEWLATLEAGRDVGPSDPRALGYDALLDRAARHFTESPRMIANRLVQAKDSLQAMGEAHRLDALLDDFLAEPEDGRRRSFGTLLHHYLNLRRQGVEHVAAAARLRQPDAGGVVP